MLIYVRGLRVEDNLVKNTHNWVKKQFHNVLPVYER